MGRHGGINILHQKSWHVGRVDNQLTVERDERRASEEEKARRSAEDRHQFQARLRTLRARAVGDDDAALEPAVPEPLTATASSNCQVGGSSSSGKPKQEKGKLSEDRYKYGRVTRANLKQAERDLDALLKHSSAKKQTAKTKEKPEPDNSGLGSGPHLNFFEEAEEAVKHQLAQHQKHIGLTQKGSELTQTSKNKLFSDFDEMSKTTPWYMQPSRKSVEEKQGQEGSVADSAALPSRMSRSPSRKVSRRERHGQVVLEVKLSKRQSQGTANPSPLAAELLRLEDSKPKQQQPEKRKRSHESVDTLREKRLKREQAERERAAAFIGAS